MDYVASRERLAGILNVKQVLLEAGRLSEMVYVTGGRIVDSRIRSQWRLGVIPEFFWGLVNFVVLFFQTLIKPNTTSRGSSYTTDYRVSGTRPGPGGGGGGGGGRPQRRMGGFRGGPGGAGPPPMAGGG